MSPAREVWSPSWRAALLAPVLAGCADVQQIENGAQYGPVTVIKDWFTSVAVIDTPAGPVLVDAGFREKTVVSGIEAAGFSASEVETVLLTHGHGDHIGGLSGLKNASVWALGPEAPVLTESSVPIARALQAGERLDFGGVSVEVLSLPGHTPGSAAYLVEGVLLLGDTCLIDSDGVVQPVAEKRSKDPRQAERSLAAIAQLLDARGDDIRWLVPSHSGAAEGLEPLRDFAARASSSAGH